MRRAFPFLLLFSFLTLLLATGCESGTSAGAADPATGRVVAGVTSDLRAGVDVDQIHVVMRVDGKVTRDEILSVAGEDPPLALPAEFPFADLAGGTKVAIELEAFSKGNTKTPLVARSASTEVIAGKSLLLRVPLDSRCAWIPGGAAPVCEAPLTCAAGVCADSSVDAHDLPAYSASWSKVSTDICKPEGAGTPVVIVGEGESDYLPLADGSVAQVESGNQGGYQIWIAIRMKGLLRSGSITTVTGHFDDPERDIDPMSVIFTFEQDEGGHCKLYGLRLRIDDGAGVLELLGKTVKVRVRVTDKDGDVGVGERTVKLSDDFF